MDQIVRTFPTQNKTQWVRHHSLELYDMQILKIFSPMAIDMQKISLTREQL